MQPAAPKNQEAHILALLRDQVVIRSRDLSPLGIHRSTLKRLCDRQIIERIGRGMYTLPGTSGTEHLSLLEAAKRVPGGVICLLSALLFHDIGTQLPHKIWMAIDGKARLPRSDSLPLRIVRFSPTSLAHGVEEHTIEGVDIRVTSPAKTIADCYKYRNKIGSDVALEALREGWRDRRFTADDLWSAARVCRVRNVIRPHLEALT